MENKQTAVERLENNLKSHFKHDGDLFEVVQMSFEQAKEMEKQQMIEAIDYCRERYIDSENYYNQKYGK